MLNEEVADLYLRTPIGTRVIVLGDAQPAPQPAPVPQSAAPGAQPSRGQAGPDRLPPIR